MLGHHTQAAGHCEAALALFRRHRHREGEALALNALAQNASQAGQHAEALAYRELAIAAFRDLGNVNHEADALNGLAHACHALGQRDRAHETWRRALDLYRMQYRTRDVESVLARLAATS
jgi:tetratricopeptide (TPR) repeat protein